MKRLLILLGLLVIALFVVSCTPAKDKESVGDLTPADLAEVEPKASGIAGKAIDFSQCADPDSTSLFDKNSSLTKSVTTYAGGSKEDKCYTWYKGTPNEKTRLIEGTCKNGKFQYWYADCDALFGKGTKCVEGVCVSSICGTNKVDPYCKDTLKITKSINTCTGEATISFNNCDKECNPSSGQGGCGGGGLTIVLGQGCESNFLKINSDKMYDCSQKKGYLNPMTCASFSPQYDFEEELLEFGKFRCLESCVPGQTITTCEDDEYYQKVCNDTGFGWTTLEEQPINCPNGQTCKYTVGSDFGICSLN